MINREGVGLSVEGKHVVEAERSQIVVVVG